MKKYIFGVLLLMICGIFACKETPVEEEQPVLTDKPAAAPAIDGNSELCANGQDMLSVVKIKNATSYVWYLNDRAVAETTVPRYVPTESGAYSVAGKNDSGEGTRSLPFEAKIVSCDFYAPTVMSDSLHFINECEFGEYVNLSVQEILPDTNGVGNGSYPSAYAWFRNGIEVARIDLTFSDTLRNADGADSVYRQISNLETARVYKATESGKYTMCGLTSKGMHGRMSAVMHVEIKACPLPTLKWIDASDLYVGKDSVFVLATVPFLPGEGQPNMTYHWYRNDTEFKTTKTDTCHVVESVKGDYTYKVAISTPVKGQGVFTPNKTVHVVIPKTVLPVSWGDIPPTATYSVKDELPPANSFLDPTNRPNNHTLSIEKGINPNELTITGLGGGDFVHSSVSATFDEATQSISITGGSVVQGLSYLFNPQTEQGSLIAGNSATPIRITGGSASLHENTATQLNEMTPAALTGKVGMVDGKVVILLQATAFDANLSYTYLYWSVNQYGDMRILSSIGVSAIEYMMPRATIITQQ